MDIHAIDTVIRIVSCIQRRCNAIERDATRCCIARSRRCEVWTEGCCLRSCCDCLEVAAIVVHHITLACFQLSVLEVWHEGVALTVGCERHLAISQLVVRTLDGSTKL